MRAEFDAEWQRRAQPAWQIEHLRRKHVLEPLLAGNERSVAQWPVERRLARAWALQAARPAAGLAELRSLYAQRPEHAGIAFACGAALLNEGDAAGVALVERVAKDDAAYRVPAYASLVAYFERRGESGQAEWAMHRDRALDRRGEAVVAFLENVEAGRMSDDGLGPDERAVLAEATSLDPCVATMWHVAGDARLATAQSANAGSLRVHALFLAVNPAETECTGMDEDAVAARYERALGVLIPPNEQGVVRTLFSTERTPAALEPRASLTAGPGI